MAEQYLLNEMSPELRDEYEDHYFGCAACAAELKATAAFMEEARKQLAQPALAAASQAGPRRVLPWKPLVTLAALAACLLVLVYQNVLLVPRLRNEVARLEQPEILPVVSLVGGNSRGGETPAGAVGDAKAVLLAVDIPASEGSTGYGLRLFSPSHKLVWLGAVTPQQAKDTLSIRVPVREGSGTYSLEVTGTHAGEAAPVTLATYSFSINTGSRDIAR